MRVSPSERDVHHCFDIPANLTILPSNLKSTTQPEAFPYKGVELLLDWIGTLIFPNHRPSLAVELFFPQLQCRRLSKPLFIWKCWTLWGLGEALLVLEGVLVSLLLLVPELQLPYLGLKGESWLNSIASPQ